MYIHYALGIPLSCAPSAWIEPSVEDTVKNLPVSQLRSCTLSFHSTAAASLHVNWARRTSAAMFAMSSNFDEIAGFLAMIIN